MSTRLCIAEACCRLNISRGLPNALCYNSTNLIVPMVTTSHPGMQAASLEHKLAAEQEACGAAQRQLTAQRQQQQQMLSQLEGAAAALQESQATAARVMHERRQLAQDAAELRRQLEDAVQLVTGELLGAIQVAMRQEDIVVPPRNLALCVAANRAALVPKVSSCWNNIFPAPHASS